MAKRRMFEVLDEMNQDDAKNKTRLVGVCPDFVRGQKTKRGMEIVMGAEDVTMQIANDELMPVLLLIDKKEFYKRLDANNAPVVV